MDARMTQGEAAFLAKGVAKSMAQAIKSRASLEYRVTAVQSKDIEYLYKRLGQLLSIAEMRKE